MSFASSVRFSALSQLVLSRLPQARCVFYALYLYKKHHVTTPKESLASTITVVHATYIYFVLHTVYRSHSSMYANTKDQHAATYPGRPNTRLDP